MNEIRQTAAKVKGQPEQLGGLLGLARYPQFTTQIEQLIARP